MALFAIVHGSMAGPAAYTRLAKELHHRAIGRCWLRCRSTRPELTGTDYARLVAEQLDAALGPDGTHSEPVVVVAHSASGLLLPLVPSFRPVAHLVYLGAGVPQSGMTLDEQLEADPDMLNPAWVGVDPFHDHQAARRFLFHDCDQEPPAGPSPPRPLGIPRAHTANAARWRGSRRSPAPRSSVPLTGSSSRPGPDGSPPTGCTPR